MGLDAYLYSVDPKYILPYEDDVRVFFDEDVSPKELCYWRKHYALNEYMQNLWVERTGWEKEAFDVSTLRLSLDDVNKWEEEMRFFPYPERSKWFVDCDHDAIRLAKEEISKGRIVFYTANW